MTRDHSHARRERRSAPSAAHLLSRSCSAMVVAAVVAGCWEVDARPIGARQGDGRELPRSPVDASGTGDAATEGGTPEQPTCGPGEVDRTFGDDGLVFATLPGWYGLATDGTDRIYLDAGSGGEWHGLRRLSPDGRTDMTFGRDGILWLPGPYERWTTLAKPTYESDGEGGVMLAAAMGSLASGNPRRTFVARITPEGHLDEAFGTQGFVEVDFGGENTVHAIHRQADRKWLVGGSSTVAGRERFAVARLTSRGALDSTFGTAGVVTAAVGSEGFVRDIAVDAEGRVLVGGPTGPSETSVYALARFRATGELDTSFGQGGVLMLPEIGRWGSGRFVQSPTGHIVVVGGRHPGRLLRRMPDGAADITFGLEGVVTMDERQGNSLLFDRAGRIVVGGQAHFNEGHTSFVRRYLPDGKEDSSFGRGGEVRTRVGYHDYGWTVREQADGKLVLGGSSLSPHWDAATILMVRYCP